MPNEIMYWEKISDTREQEKFSENLVYQEKMLKEEWYGKRTFPVVAGSTPTIPETHERRSAAMNLFGTLRPEAREELTRHRIVRDPDGTFPDNQH